MANWHLDELLLALTAAGWNLINTMPAKTLGVAEFWKLTHAGYGSPEIVAFLEFHVELDDNVDPAHRTVEHSYGCAVRYNPNVAVHFYKHRKDWDEYLQEFMDQLAEMAAENALVKTA